MKKHYVIFYLCKGPSIRGGGDNSPPPQKNKVYLKKIQLSCADNERKKRLFGKFGKMRK